MNTAEQTTKQAIANTLRQFSAGDLKSNALALLEVLGYRSAKHLDLLPNTPQSFVDTFDGSRKLNADKLLLGEWWSVDFLFQLTGDEITTSSQVRLPFDSAKKVDSTVIESYLFFAVGLQRDGYTRTQLAGITREINKVFPMPVMVVFRHGSTLTLSIINRRLHKRDEAKDVLEKVTVIKDIALAKPHRAHIEILYDLSLQSLYDHHRFANFVELHNAWQKTLDSSELNKRFFREVANWYFWAKQIVVFPSGAGNDPETRNATSVIRLITRLIFVWFIREKGLVPDDLFNKRKVDQVLNYADPKGSTYYKAILQNLFFATLNQEMNTPGKRDRRDFRRDGQNYNVTNLYRYKSYFKDADQALRLFDSVPFLNGGLFECLDKPDKDDAQKVARLDGFSDRPDNELSVPDDLFFGDSRDIDLNETYDTRSKRYTVRGLINILDRYKFTIEENTPIEEEIALDPELLGKVFENLLASYNPETGVTARKQTGSFYTPREIVDYMVDESLVAYLDTQLRARIAELAGMKDLPDLLREVFAYTEKAHPFNEQEVAVLVGAIDDVKVLDPACGSGAFPMGILHKLVFILGKLDPHNQLWKKRQIAKAGEIPDSVARQSAIEGIEQAFARNELDYGRKLFLIENCIYGVDIQPIAAQIAKLRCFISLVVDEKVDDARANRGITPLPNLETKFVAANGLVGLQTSSVHTVGRDGTRAKQDIIRNPAVVQKEQELAYVRRRHFEARTHSTKEKYRQLDARIRSELAFLLQQDGWLPSAAAQMAAWDPYDQNGSSPFFDPEWMFNFRGGFDIVIGNPPYARVQMLQQTQAGSVSYFKDNYLSARGSFDIYVLFVEKGYSLLSDRGTFCYILPHKFFQAKFGEPIREFLAKRKAIHQIVRFGAEQVFGESTTYTCLLFLTREPNDSFRMFEVRSLNDSAGVLSAIQAGVPRDDYHKAVITMPTGTTWQFTAGSAEAVIRRLLEQSHTLGDITRKIFQGIPTGTDKVFVLRVIADAGTTMRCFSAALGRHVEIERGLLKPFLLGKDVHRYRPAVAHQVVVFPYIAGEHAVSLMPRQFIKQHFPLGWDYLVQNQAALSAREGGRFADDWHCFSRPQNLAEFETVKIMTPDICNGPQMSIDITGSLYHTTTLYSFVFNSNLNDSPRYFLGILNSRVLGFFLKSTGTVLRGGYFRFKTEYLKPFPIPCSRSTRPPSKALHDEIVVRVDRILGAKQAKFAADTSALESEIDQLVYESYGLTPEEIAIVEEATFGRG